MITDADIKKMKAVFATKDDLKSFVTKKDLKNVLQDYPTRKEMNIGFHDVINFISETRKEIVGIMTKQLEELKDITRRHQMMLEKHDSRITHLEYLNNS